MANNRLLENIMVDLNISPELERLMSHNAEIAPKATKLGLRKVTREGSKQVKARIRSLGLVKSGKYVKSVRGSTTNSKSFIGTKDWKAHILEGGAQPHKIKPRKKKMLFIGGRFAKSVQHPGIKAYDIFEGAYQQMESSGQVQSLFSQGVQEAIEAVQNGG